MYQQDSAPPHKPGIVSNLLKTMFSNIWVGKTVSIHRPPRSPDLILLDSSFGATFYVNYYKRAVNEFYHSLQITLKQCWNGQCLWIIKMTSMSLYWSEGGHFQHFSVIHSFHPTCSRRLHYKKLSSIYLYVLIIATWMCNTQCYNETAKVC